MDFATAYAGRSPAMVDFSATVTSGARFFHGSRSRYEHEAFDVRTSAGPAEVVDNVSIAPSIPVRVGDRVEVRGEMVHDPGREPIVHFTHRDPQGTHPDGFIRLHDKLYA
jgi:hypothetical protein